jgi:alpha/beta superfamily hydrolase
MLDARLDLPTGDEPLDFAIVSHCFTCSKDSLIAFRISRGLAQAGIGALRFDFTGLGNSEGEFADTNFTTMIEDILSAADYMQQHYGTVGTLLGHSMGGTASLIASTRLPLCRSVVTIASPSEPVHVLHHFGPILDRLEADEEANIRVAGVDYPVKPQFVSDLRAYDMKKLFTAYAINLLVIRAGQDTLVNHGDAQEILAYSSGTTTMIDLQSADHLFTDRSDSNAMVEAIISWLLDKRE